MDESAVKESVLVGKQTLRTVIDDYLVCRVDANGRLEVIAFIAPGALQDVNIIQVLGAALAAGNPVIVGIFDAAGNRMPSMDIAARAGFVDVIDRAGRLVGIVYGDTAQLQQITPADGLVPADSLEAASFLMVYNGVTWDMVREGNVAGSLLSDVTDRAARLLGVVYGDLAQLQQIAAPGDALAPANTLESTGLLYVYNGATWDRVLEGAVAGSILTDPADRAGRLVGIVYGSLAQIQQLAALADGVNPSNTLESTGMLYVYNGATWDRVREGATAGSIITEDTGLNTNPERWLQDNHWDSGVELVINAAAAVNLGAAVGAGVTRRIREITVRNTAVANTVITLSDAGGNRLSFDVPAQSTRTWSSQDGREFLATVQPQIASSAGAVGSEAYITASGVEA